MKDERLRGLAALALSTAMMAATVFGVSSLENAFAAESLTDVTPNEALADAADGTYTGVSKGFGGEITATVTIEKGIMTEIGVVGNSETQGIGSRAVEELPALIVENQSLEIDGISGATISSNAVKKAVQEALSGAGVELEASIADAVSGATAEADGVSAATAETESVDAAAAEAESVDATAAATSEAASE